jgi:flagellar biogenesis protein FliO
VVNPDPASAPVRMPPLKVAKPPPFPGASLTPDGMTLIRFFGAFVAVVAVLLICLKIIAWLGRGRRPAKGGRAFTLRGTMALDGRRYLAAVEVDGHLVVVGVTPERLTGLAHWALEDDLFDGPSIGGPLPDPPAPKKPPRPAAAAGPTLEKTAGFPTVFPEAGAAGPPPKEPPTGSGRDAPDFTLALDETPYEGQQTNDDLRKLDLGDD